MGGAKGKVGGATGHGHAMGLGGLEVGGATKASVVPLKWAGLGMDGGVAMEMSGGWL